MLREHPDEVTADMRQYYGLDVAAMGDGYSVLHAAALVSQLPRSSRTVRAVDERATWGDSEALLSLIEYQLRVIAWQNTEDGAKDRNRPRPIPVPGVAEAKAKRAREFDRELIDRVLGGVG